MARVFTASMTLILALDGSPVTGQTATWRISALGGIVAADGGFSTMRENGKTVTSDIDGGAYVALGMERALSARWAVSLGYETTTGRTYRIDQDFPDQTSFSSSDTFDYRAVAAGASLTFVDRTPIVVRVEPTLSWGWVNDFTLSSAGPPYDRTVPLAIDGRGRLGGGLALSGVLPLGESGWGLIIRSGLVIQKVVGDFPADPALPGSEGSIATPLNPIHAAFGVTYGR